MKDLVVRKPATHTPCSTETYNLGDAQLMHILVLTKNVLKAQLASYVSTILLFTAAYNISVDY